MPCMRVAVVVVIALALTSCGGRGPEIPPFARAQIPHAAPDTRWFGEGRLELVAPGKRLSCTALVRGLGHGQARLALVSDEGVLLADLTAGPAGCTVNQKLAAMDRAIPLLERMLRQAWTAHDGDKPTPSHDRLAMTDGLDTRWYGGDPVLLRAVEGDGLDLDIGDWRLFGDTLLPWAVTGHATLGIVTVTIHLNKVRPL